MTNTVEILRRLANSGIPSKNLVVGKEIADHCAIITGFIYEVGQEKHVISLIWFSKIPGPYKQYNNRFMYQELAQSMDGPLSVKRCYELCRHNDDDPVVMVIKLNTGEEFYFSMTEYKLLPEKPVFVRKKQHDFSWR